MAIISKHFHSFVKYILNGTSPSIPSIDIFLSDGFLDFLSVSNLLASFSLTWNFNEKGTNGGRVIPIIKATINGNIPDLGSIIPFQTRSRYCSEH
ncbi:unnamed protein product [Schistosoma mattheei]|uniref:Uncharacterized protein n=1 Tax=Schistosoma mattheei TaxID=31246 RepID=A0A183NSE0_9TREM|nr:unnamed protein product [Schistosoma mattheei]